MAKTCKKVNPKLTGLRTAVQKFSLLADPSSKDYSTRLNQIRLAHIKPDSGLTEEDFILVLLEYNIDLSFSKPVVLNRVKLLQNLALAFKKLSTLFRNATSAFGFMKHDFNVRVFKSIFIDNTNYHDGVDEDGDLLNDTILRVPLNVFQINANIAELKNNLIKIICDYFDILLDQKVFKYSGANSVINEKVYIEILNNKKVLDWIATIIPNLPVASPDTLSIFSALFILNNFDDLVATYLPKILTVDKSKRGEVANVNYVKEFEGNAPSIWSVDDLVTYGSDLYASNLGKFILSTVLRVDADLKPVKDSYMSSLDAFVLASLLREAEYEYHILYRNKPDYDPDLSLKKDASKAVKVLLSLGIKGELESLKKYLKEIYPVYNWLYNLDETSDIIGVLKIYKDLFSKGRVGDVTQILNLGSVLIGEIIKNVAPVYLEMSTYTAERYKDNPIRTINLSHSFRGRSYITLNLLALILDEMLLDYSSQNVILKGELSKDLIELKSVEELLTDGTEESQAFLDTFELLFGVPLSREFLNSMGLGLLSNAKKYVEDIIFLIAELFSEASGLKDAPEAFFNKSFLNIFLKKSSDFYNKYTNVTLTVADRKTDLPITIIKNSLKKSIPIYRLGSNIFEDVYLINLLKKGRDNRKSLNFFIDNLHTLSKYNNPDAPVGETQSINESYLGSTGLRLETISENLSNPANNSSGKEAYINSFLGDFLGLGIESDDPLRPKGKSISVLLMTYSDKASIFTKIINLDAVVKGYGDVVLNKSIDSMTNGELLDMYYFFRKNLVVDLIFHIIETWNKILNLGLTIPDINEELLNTKDLLPPTSTFILNSWKIINDAFKTTEVQITNDKGEKVVTSLSLAGSLGIEYILRLYKSNNPNSNISLTKELHFSFYSGELALNKNIYYQYKQTSSKLELAKKVDSYIDKNLSHPWMIALSQQLFRTESGELNEAGMALFTKYCLDHGFSTDPLGFKNVLRRKILLENFFRSLLLDFHFKGTYLDTVKSLPNYDETEDEEYNIIEADARMKAAGKRTVDLPGTKLYFALGLIDGVSLEAYVAHIEEPTEEVWSPDGTSERGLEILNGSGRIHFIYAMMESASMTGSPFKGINRKTLGTHVDDFYSTLYKWAEYLINNWHMRNSTRSKYNLIDLFGKMSRIPFDEEINLTKSFLRPNGVFTPELANGNKPVYFAKGMHYFLLKAMSYIGNNTYNLWVIEVDERGLEYEDLSIPENLVPTKNIRINTIEDLFNVLGGAESMDKDSSGNLQYSNNSLYMLYRYVVNIGEIINEDYDELNLESVRLPLRDKFISIAASNSGIKRGETNINGKEVYTNKEVDLLTSKIRTALFGALMDVFHHIDSESEATEPTLTLAALATNGNTMEEANSVYLAIASIIYTNMKEVANASLIEYNESNAQTIIKELTKDVVNIINENGSDLQQAIAELCNAYLGSLIPLSDPLFYNAFHSYNIKKLNELALRRKYSGLGGVLNPSSNSYLLFAVNGLELEYDDLVKRARKFFKQYSDILNDFSTEEIACLYLFSCTTEGGKPTQETYIDTNGQTKLKSFVYSILDNILNLNEESVESALNYLRETVDVIKNNINNFYEDGILVDIPTSKTVINACGKLIEKGRIDPLDTIFYIKEGIPFKATLDTAKKYFEFINDPLITEVWLDITTPHDLKPLIIKYSYNSEVHSLYDSDAGELSSFFKQLEDSDIEDILADIAEDGLEIEKQCSLI